mgnify:CR=1 FL=1
MQGSILVIPRSLFSTSYNKTTGVQPMKIIFLLSALLMSIAPAQAQQQRFTLREKSIFFAGTILGAGITYCRFQKEGKVSDKDRKEHMESMLDIYKNKTPATKDYGEIIDRVYASAIVCH